MWVRSVSTVTLNRSAISRLQALDFAARHGVVQIR